MPFVLLDWDNTLHDSAGTNFAALEMVLRGYGLHVSPDAYRRAYTVDYRRLYRDLGLADELVNEASDRWRALVAGAEPRLLPGVVEALDRLQADGHTLALVTSAPRAVAERQVLRLGLLDRFAACCYGDGQPPRPDPQPVRDLLASMGAYPADALLCSDTAVDMQMAVAAGVRGIGIASFAFDAGALCAGGAVETAPSLHAWVAGDGAPCAGAGAGAT
jgi:phosphoglycolate phosphatase